MWYKANNFFEETDDQQLNNLFTNSEFVWEILDKLENFIQDTVKANVKSIIHNGNLILKPTVIFNNTILNENISFELGDPSKKKLKVYYKNKLLEDASLILPGAYISDENIEIGKGVLIETGAMIKGPTILKDFTEIRQGAYIRGNTIALSKSLIGHNTEVKNSIFLNNAKAGHFSYLGDSILGKNCNLGAGTKLANLKMVKKNYTFKYNNEIFSSNRSKIGAIIGDFSQTGCNSVTSPGTLLAKNCKILPNINCKAGFYPSESLIK